MRRRLLACEAFVTLAIVSACGEVSQQMGPLSDAGGVPCRGSDCEDEEPAAGDSGDSQGAGGATGLTAGEDPTSPTSSGSGGNGSAAGGGGGSGPCPACGGNSQGGEDASGGTSSTTDPPLGGAFGQGGNPIGAGGETDLSPGAAGNGGTGGVPAEECELGDSEPCGSEEGECTLGTRECVAGQWAECQGGVLATEEVCNGLDDDCNAVLDDLVAPLCPLQEGVCAGSVEVCAGELGSTPCSAASYGPAYQAVETLCDGQDNDCDGEMDQGCECLDGDTRECLGECAGGQQTCVGGIWGQCDGVGQPMSELCNSLDDDCDGDVDEDFSLLGTECSAGTGECSATASYECSGDGLSAVCPAVAGEPGDEVCNGKDDNCDGQSDEGLSGIVTEPELMSNALTEIPHMAFDANGEPQFSYLVNFGGTGNPTDTYIYYSTLATRSSGSNNDPLYAAVALREIDYKSEVSYGFDAEGHPALCWLPFSSSGDTRDLVHGYYDPDLGDFAMEVIATDEAHNACAITVDAQGIHHIAYFKRSSSDQLTVISRRPGSAFPTTRSIGNGSGDGLKLSWASDSAGTLHLAFAISRVDSVTFARVHSVRYSVDFESALTVEQGASAFDFGFTLDAADAPHLALVGGGGGMQYATLETDGSWTLEPVSTDEGVDQGLTTPQIAIDSDGLPMIAYGIQYAISTSTFRNVHFTHRLSDGTWLPNSVESDAIALADGLFVMPSGTGRVLYRKVNQIYQSFLCR
jgi:hypothetical protein